MKSQRTARAVLGVAIVLLLTAGSVLALTREPALDGVPAAAVGVDDGGGEARRSARGAAGSAAVDLPGSASGVRGTTAAAPEAHPFDELDWPPASNPDPDFPLTVAVRPSCGSAGDAMRASIRTLPDTWIAMIVIYGDGDPRQTWYTGQVAADGSFTFPWVVPPDAPEGSGRVAVTATHDDRDQAASATVPFRVAAVGGCA